MSARTRPGPGPRPSGAPARDLELAHQGNEGEGVVALPGAGDPGQRPAPGVGQQVDLAGQPAPGAAQSLPVLVIRLSPLRRAGALSSAGASRAGSTSAGGRRRAPAACWCARTTVASAATVHAWPCRLITPGAQRVQDLLPGPISGPAAMPVIDGLPVPEPLRQIPPRAPRPGPEEDPVDHQPVIIPPVPLPRMRRAATAPAAPTPHRSDHAASAGPHPRRNPTGNDPSRSMGHALAAYAAMPPTSGPPILASPTSDPTKIKRKSGSVITKSRIA